MSNAVATTVKLTRAQVEAACQLYARRVLVAEGHTVADEAVFLTTSKPYFVQEPTAPPSAAPPFDHVLVNCG